MKYVYLALFLNLGISFSAEAQVSQVWEKIAQSHYNWSTLGSGSWGIIDSGQFHYNARGIDDIDTSYAVYGIIRNYRIDHRVYDGSGYLLADTILTWDSTSHRYGAYTWIIYRNNAAGLPITATTKGVNSTYRDSFVYDAGNKPLVIFYQYSTGNTWENRSKQIFQYDVNQRDSLFTFLSYNSSTHLLDSNNRTYMLYNAQGKPISTIKQEYYSGAGWHNSNRQLMTYDGAGNMIHEERSTMSNLDTVWYGDYMSDHYYDANNDTTLDLYFSNIGGNPAVWDTLERYVYTYTTGQTLVLWDRWHMGSGWAGVEAFVTSYDNSGKEISYEVRGPNSATPGNITYYTYDSHDNLTYELHQDAHFGTTYTNSSQYFYYYKLLDVSNGITDAQEELAATVYPNPASGRIVLSLPHDAQVSLDLYDMTGRLIQSDTRYAEAGAPQFLDYSSLSRGIYTLRVQEPHTGSKKSLRLILE